ncbi:MAG: hypothetical protein JXR03_21505 [Cyclobacteriaceae bacterium]
MKTELQPDELAPLADFINDCYVGDLPSLCNDLTKTMYLLHHVKRDEVLDEEEIEEACLILYQIHQRVFTIYAKQQETKS